MSLDTLTLSHELNLNWAASKQFDELTGKSKIGASIPGTRKLDYSGSGEGALLITQAFAKVITIPAGATEFIDLQNFEDVLGQLGQSMYRLKYAAIRHLAEAETLAGHTGTDSIAVAIGGAGESAGGHQLWHRDSEDETVLYNGEEQARAWTYVDEYGEAGVPVGEATVPGYGNEIQVTNLDGDSPAEVLVVLMGV